MGTHRWARLRGVGSWDFLHIDHEDYKANLRLNLNQLNGSGSIEAHEEENGAKEHGTHTTGIIAAAHNGIGMVGGCHTCSIIVSKSRDYAENLTKTGIQVLNLSKGTDLTKLTGECPEDTSALLPNEEVYCSMIAYAKANDVLIVAAAGNGDDHNNLKTSVGISNHLQFPASNSLILSVGSYDFSGYTSSFSNYGSIVDLMAPGKDIFSTIKSIYISPSDGLACGDPYTSNQQLAEGLEFDDDYGVCSGTSMAAPMVTSIAALVRATDPWLSAWHTKAILQDSKQPISDTALNGFGYAPDAKKAVELTLGKVNGALLRNRLTPLYSLYSSSVQDSFYSIVPQMVIAAAKGTMSPVPVLLKAGYDGINEDSVKRIDKGANKAAFYNLNYYGNSTPVFSNYFENIDQFKPQAEVYVFTTSHNPIIPEQKLIPLKRFSYAANFSDSDRTQPITDVEQIPNIDHTYITNESEIAAYESVGYKYEGVEGYVFDPSYAQPEGSVKLVRLYHPERDDHAIVPEGNVSYMKASGYEDMPSHLESVIGYVYLNVDSDGDKLIVSALISAPKTIWPNLLI